MISRLHGHFLYQSIAVIAAAQKTFQRPFDLIICDEAHRTTGITLKDEEDSAFVKVHDNAFIQAKQRLYMTATPRLYAEESKKKAQNADAYLCSMDDEAMYGPEVFRIGFGEAVDKNLLADYKVLVLTLAHEFAELLNHVAASQAGMSVAVSRAHAGASHFLISMWSGTVCGGSWTLPMGGFMTCGIPFRHPGEYRAFPVCRAVPAGEQYPHVTMRYAHLEQRALLAATNAVSGFLDAATTGADAPEQGGKPV